MENNIRKSNFELLRIFCMFGVLLNHVLQNLWNIHVPEITLANECRIFLMNIAIVAVNCFVLISGYFTIRLSWKGIIRYYFQCAFYIALFVLVKVLIGGTIGTPDIIRIIFACTAGEWFVRCYFALMLLSPLLNSAIEKIDKQRLRNFSILLLIIDVYIGYMHQVHEVAAEGYELTHLTTLYVLGAQIAREKFLWANKCGWYALCMFFVMTILHMIKMRFFPISIIYSLHYNSPCLIISSLLVFIWCTTWQIQNKWINYIASSVFAVYLIHCNQDFSPFFWEFMKSAQKIGTTYTTPLFVALAMIFSFIGFVGIDKIRILLTQRMEHKLISKTIKIWDQLTSK